jgi:Fur family transcriptional regulator, ferric uptake regulator
MNDAVKYGCKRASTVSGITPGSCLLQKLSFEYIGFMDRQTRQRNAIQLVLKASDRPLGVQEVFESARSILPQLGVATVYRTIKALTQEGLLVPVDLPGENPLYEAAGKSHHHHFRCRGCAHVYELEGCLPNLKELTPPGFSFEGHEIVLYGLCSSCGPKDTAAARRRAHAPKRATSGANRK